MSRSKILFVINSLEGGGAERVLLELLAASRDRTADHDISLALLDHAPHAYAVPDWLAIHSLDSRSSLHRSYFELARLIRRERPALTLSFLTRSNVVAVGAARRFGHHAIISERVNTSSHLSGGMGAFVSRQLVRASYPRADRVIAVSDGIADDLRRNFAVPADKLVTIANPVNFERVRAAAAETVRLPVDGPFMVSVSRLSKNKNAILAVEALARSATDLSLVILGEGPERAAIAARASELGIAGRVILAGFVPNPYPILSAASCYVSGSNAEGFPNALVEALALGIPVIHTNCPSGPSEILADRARGDVQGIVETECGYLVPQDDSDAMASVMNLAALPERRAAMAAAGRRRASRYSVEAARDAYWRVIDETLALSSAGK